MQATVFTETDYAAQINDALFEIKADTSYNAYSGLTAENVEGSEAVVKIFDDHASGEYYADQVIEALKSVEVIDTETETAFEPVWDAISKAAI